MSTLTVGAYTPTNPASRFGLVTGAATPHPSELNGSVTPAEGTPSTLLHPHNPLLAFGVLAAVVFGLMAASTTVRVGKTSATVAVGTTK